MTFIYIMAAEKGFISGTVRLGWKLTKNPSSHPRREIPGLRHAARDA